MQQSGRVAVLAGVICLCLSAITIGKTSKSLSSSDSDRRFRKVKPYQAPRGYVCCRAPQPIVVDGKLDDAAWQEVPWTDDFVDIEGDRKPLPRFRTRAKMLWDDQYFYIAAELTEPHIWGTLTTHDSVIFQDNDFEVFIDPNSDNHEYYEFEMNVLNTGWDLLLPRPYKDGGHAVNGWEIPGLKTGVAIDGSLNDPQDTDRGWSVELAFPWAALGELAFKPTPPREKDQWRIDFSRVEWQHEVVDGKYRRVPGTKEDNWVWSPQGVIDMHRPETWGIVQFSAAKPGADQFVADDAGPNRHLLHEVYYAQQDFRKQHNRWAKTIRELGFEPDAGDVHNVKLTVAGDQFQATLPHINRDGKRVRWHIRQDSRVWSD